MTTAERILNDHIWMGTKPSKSQRAILSAMKEYAAEMCNLQKKACCEAALVETMEDDGIITASRHKEIAGHIVAINRQSILNTKNVVYELD